MPITSPGLPYFWPVNYASGVPTYPFLGSIVRLNSSHNSGRKKTTSVYWSSIKDITKNPDEKPSVEEHRVRTRRSSSTGLSVPVELRCSTRIYSPTWKIFKSLEAWGLGWKFQTSDHVIDSTSLQFLSWSSHCLCEWCPEGCAMSNLHSCSVDSGGMRKIRMWHKAVRTEQAGYGPNEVVGEMVRAA